MNIIQIDHGGGKTVLALHQALLKGCPLIVRDEVARDKIKSLVDRFKKIEGGSIIASRANELTVWTYQQFMDAIHSKSYKYNAIVIDDIDLIFQDYYGVKSMDITLTSR